MTALSFLASWFGLSLVTAPLVGRFLAGAETSRHAQSDLGLGPCEPSS